MSTPTANAVRVAGRLTVAFLLDFVEIGRGDRAPIDALLMLGMVQANVAPVSREPDLQRTYAAYADVIPDEMRRPTSISSLSNSLRLPYETVRRRVADMQRRGLCVVTSAGAYVPVSILTHPEHMTAVFRTYDLLRTFYYRLSDLGLMQLPAPTDVEPLDAVQQIRAIMRLLGDYVLRTVDAVTVLAADVVSGLILLGIFRANTSHRLDPADGRAEDGMLADEDRLPVSVAALAAQLHLPAETVRRHVAQLLAEGRCVRAPRGLIVPVSRMMNEDMLALIDENFTHLMRLFTNLAQLGVLSAWDAARPAELPALAAR